MDVKKVLSTVYEPYDVTLTEKDMILYALGVGFSKDPLNKDHFKFTYEKDEDF